MPLMPKSEPLKLGLSAMVGYWQRYTPMRASLVRRPIGQPSKKCDSAETAKGKKERVHQGRHNNRAPFGYKKNKDKKLVPDEDELPGLIMAYEEYATDQYSDTDIANLLNKAGYKSKTGRPFSNALGAFGGG